MQFDEQNFLYTLVKNKLEYSQQTFPYRNFMNDFYDTKNIFPKIPTERVFSWAPRRCSVTREIFWLTHCFKVSKVNEETCILETQWHSPRGHTLWLLKETHE